MTKFEVNSVRFSYRVAAVILHQSHVLLQGEPGSDVWTLPGGGVEPAESSYAAITREVREELGVDIRIERLLWIVEQFFVAGGKSNHEIGLYFLVSPTAAAHLYALDQTFKAVDGFRNEIEIIFRWFRCDTLTDITLYPTFLPAALLQELPAATQHIILTGDE